MYIAVDIGGTKTQIARFSGNNPSSQQEIVEFTTPKRYADAITQISASIKSLSTHFTSGLGIAIATQMDEVGQIVSRSNLPDYLGKNIRVDLLKGSDFAKESIIVNDTVAAALAQLGYGNLKVSTLLHLVVGTGVGGTYVNTTFSPTLSLPLEPGWMIMHPGGLPHTHSQVKGLLEAYVGGAQLSAQIGRPLHVLSDDDLIWSQCVNYLGMAVNNLIVLLNPSHITLSGGLIEKRPILVSRLQRYVVEHNQLEKNIPIELTRVTNPSLLGALWLIQQKTPHV